MVDVLVNVEDALRAAIRSGRYLCRLCPNPRKALEIIRPYADCSEYVAGERVKPEDREKLLCVVRSMVCAATADAYREMGEIGTAAEWYRRAGDSWKVGGFSGIYAEMVLRHRLNDHYQAALDCLRHSLADWQVKPFLVRVYWHIVSGWLWRPWLYAPMWRTWFRQQALVAELEARVSTQG